VAKALWLPTETDTREALEAALATERARLVGLCAHLTGDALAAEDLAQETLLEAWRSRGKLYDPAGVQRWLSAIARNVCARWLRTTARQMGRRAMGSDLALEAVPDGADMHVELERQELDGVLDRALALLPVATRAACVAHYLHGAAHAEIAAQLGTSEDAVKMRLHRGRATLRRSMLANWRADVESLDIAAVADSSWRETRIWCPQCGCQRLLIRIVPPPGIISLRCARCVPDETVSVSDYRLANRYFATLLGGRRQPRAILDRAAHWNHTYFRAALESDGAPCTHCGRATPLRWMVRPGISARQPAEPVLVTACSACGEACSTSFSGLVMAHPALRDFWREQRRIRALPHRHVERVGRAVIVSRFESLTSAATLDIVSAAERFDVLHIHPAPSAVS
jgi:RNA polymerase sigma-70 factor (ECF subfamily)